LCLMTDVGESRSIVGDTGKVVPNSSPELIAEAVVGLLELTPEDRLDIGRQARERIRARFAIQDIALRYLRVYGCERNMRQVTASLNTER
jgi:glycosyltransferase involved in cell wall biosynthesis